MQVIGKDNRGHLIAVESGLLSTTFYRSSETTGLSDLGFDWEALGTIINSNPIIQGLGAKIAGQGRQVVPINAQPVVASGPGFFGSINPTYLLLGGLGLAAVLLMRK